MGLEERLADLLERGEKQMAEQLAKAVVSGSTSVSVALDGDDQAVVQHDRFRGTHDITTDSAGEFDVSQWGEYVFTGHDGQFEMRFEAPNQRVVERANTLLGRRESEPEPEPEPRSESGGASRTSLVDRLLHR